MPQMSILEAKFRKSNLRSNLRAIRFSISQLKIFCCDKVAQGFLVLGKIGSKYPTHFNLVRSQARHMGCSVYFESTAVRTFSNFDDLTKQVFVWRNQIANQREHRTTRKVVRILFESVEKPKLLALNPVPYDTDEIFSRSVTSDFHLQYETNRYSVPWTLVGLTIAVRVNNQELRFFTTRNLSVLMREVT